MTEILAEARKHVDIDIYIPDLKNDKLPNRKFKLTSAKMKKLWVFIVNTLIPEELQTIVDEVKQDNEERNIYKEKNLSMRVFPKFERMFADGKEASSKLKIINYFKM